MRAIDRRSALMGILRGAAIVAAGVAVLPSAAEAMEIRGSEALKTQDFFARAQTVVVAPRRRRRRRWACWWRRGRRICGWRWV